MSKRLILYDTSNFMDYPVGGQLTSIKSFLRYLGENYFSQLENIVLVGVSVKPDDIGKISKIQVDGYQFSFLAVALAELDQNKVKKSLRLEYVKGLFKLREKINITSDDCNYIHTPEAFAVIRFLCHKSHCYVLSHGSYMNMRQHLRFFRKTPFIRTLFQRYLILVIRYSNGIFVLDQQTEKEYRKFNRNVTLVGNSIICQEFIRHKVDLNELHLVYSGRLSAGKNIAPIIEAVKSYPQMCRLVILGAGEEMDNLKKIANERICFVGAVAPDRVKEYLKESDILIMNSLYEGIPMAILEAISFSLPVITTDVGGIGEILDFGTDSEKTDGSSESICQALTKIINNYSIYSVAAYKKSLFFDYRKVNRVIFEQLNSCLEWIK